MTHQSLQSSANRVPRPPSYPISTETVGSVFSVPSYLGKEDTRVYKELLARVRADVKPRDVFEEIWTADIVHVQVDIFRMRHIKNDLASAGLMAHGAATLMLAAHKVYKNPDDDNLTGIERIARAYLCGQLTESDIEKFLAGYAERSPDTAKAYAFAEKILTLMQIDQMIAMAEKRRDSALRSIARHRAMFGKTLRGVLQEAEEAEFEIIGPIDVDKKNVR